MAADEANTEQLDALWDETRDQIEIETRGRLGVLSSSGKNSPVFAAMRRNVQREWTNQTNEAKKQTI